MKLEDFLAAMVLVMGVAAAVTGVLFYTELFLQ